MVGLARTRALLDLTGLRGGEHVDRKGEGKRCFEPDGAMENFYIVSHRRAVGLDSLYPYII